MLHASQQTSHSLTVLKLLTALMDFYMAFGVKPFPRECAKKATQTACVLYTALSKESVRLGKAT